MKFRKKPVVIEAEQWFPVDSVRGVCRCAGGLGPHVHTCHEGQIVSLASGDWIVPEPNGNGFYPIAADVMEATYDRVDG